MNELEQKTLEKFDGFVFEKSPSNEFLIELIQSAGSYLNLKTIPKYAEEKNMSYQGVKMFREIKEIFGVKFVIDNI